MKEVGGEKMTRPKVAWITGISGSGRTDYINETIAFAQERGKKIATFNTGNMMGELIRGHSPNVRLEHILNMPYDELAGWRMAATYDIANTIREYAGNGAVDAVLIDTHATFYRKKITRDGFDWRQLELVQPDLYATIIADERTMYETLQAHHDPHFLELSEEDILHWQNNEVRQNQQFGRLHGKPWYAIPRKQSDEILYTLLFYPERKLTYVAYSMTNTDDTAASEEQEKFIEDFLIKLKTYVPVMNPRAADPTGGNPMKPDLTSWMHIVERDEDWLVKPAAMTIVLFPSEPKFSAGAVCEAKHGIQTTGEVYWVFNSDRVSPFQTVYSHQIFKNPDEFWDFFHRNLYKDTIPGL